MVERLVGQRNQPAPVLAGTFRQKLLQPRAEIGDSRRGNDRHLVAAEARCRNAQRDAKLNARILCGGTSGPQARSIDSAVSSSRLTSRPIAAAGTSPNFDSTE